MRSAGDVAITGYSMLARQGPVVLLQCRLYTGKTHQIRVHLKDVLGIEILNDGKYGNRRLFRSLEMPIDRKALYLHCWRMKLQVNGLEKTVGLCNMYHIVHCGAACSPEISLSLYKLLVSFYIESIVCFTEWYLLFDILIYRIL